MPIKIKDLQGGLGNIIEGFGVLTDKEYVDALKEHLTQDREKFKRYRYSLGDFTAITKAEVSPKSISLIADLCVSAAKANREVIVGIAGAQDLVFGLIRMWDSLGEGTGWESEVFRSRQEAEAWIMERAKEKYGIDDLTFS